MNADGVVKIFQRVLETDDIEADSNFFVFGGDSLLATRVLSAIAREFGVELSFADFLNAPSPAALSRQILSSAA